MNYILGIYIFLTVNPNIIDYYNLVSAESSDIKLQSNDII